MLSLWSLSESKCRSMGFGRSHTHLPQCRLHLQSHQSARQKTQPHHERHPARAIAGVGRRSKRTSVGNEHRWRRNSGLSVTAANLRRYFANGESYFQKRILVSPPAGAHQGQVWRMERLVFGICSLRNTQQRIKRGDLMLPRLFFSMCVLFLNSFIHLSN